MNRHLNSKGLTFLSFLIASAVLIGVVLLGFRVVPAYIEHYSVVDSLNNLQARLDDRVDNSDLDRSAIQNTLDRLFDVNAIHSIAAKDVEIIQNKEGFSVRASYEVNIGLFGNVSLLLNFDNQVAIKRNAS